MPKEIKVQGAEKVNLRLIQTKYAREDITVLQAITEDEVIDLLFYDGGTKRWELSILPDAFKIFEKNGEFLKLHE